MDNDVFILLEFSNQCGNFPCSLRIFLLRHWFFLTARTSVRLNFVLCGFENLFGMAAV